MSKSIGIKDNRLKEDTYHLQRLARWWVENDDSKPLEEGLD